MPYNPNFPQDFSLIDAPEFREQFQSLKALIDANPGGGITNVVIDGVSTLPPGSAATVSASVSGGVLHLQFGLPQGNTGQDGQAGQTGQDGAPGLPFATVIVDAVNTLPPGSAATVSATFDGTKVHLTFGLPQGNDGAQGMQGNDGIQGPPGEVTAAQLATAISATSSNSNAVTTLDTPFSNDPASLADMELMRAKYNELVLALRR